MSEEIIIDGELSCNNCMEKTRCKQQQEAKKQRIDAILSYIANEDNEKHIAELKNEIPAITRCDVILEKQLKRLQAENDGLKSTNDFVVKQLERRVNQLREYRKALEEIRGILCKGRTFYDGYFENENLSRTDKAIKVISEVLDERN